MQRGMHTRAEILAQPEAWADALEVVEKSRGKVLSLFHAGYQQVLFTGCGSTYYLSQAAAALYQEMTGRLARAVPGGELLLNPSAVSGSGQTLLVAVSRSGRQPETMRAVEEFRKKNRDPCWRSPITEISRWQTWPTLRW